LAPNVKTAVAARPRRGGGERAREAHGAGTSELSAAAVGSWTVALPAAVS